MRDSINTVEELIDYAIELGHDVIAFTEHETISNAIKIEDYYETIKKEHPNFKVIRGNEIYLCRNGLDAENYESGKDKFYHFILLAKDKIGHQQIRELSTRAWLRSFKQGKMIRRPTYYQDLLEIIGTNKGHVIGSTACIGGFLPSHILSMYENTDEDIREKILKWTSKVEDIFGKGNFFLEMQPSENKEQILVNTELLKISQILNIPYIITTDSHYKNKDEAMIHKAFLRSQEGEREVDTFYATTYMMSTEELESFFKYFNEQTLQIAYENIEKIKNMCEDYSLKRPLKIPSLKWVEQPKPKEEIVEKYKKLIPSISLFLSSDFNGDNVLAYAIINKIESNKRLQDKTIYLEVEDNLIKTWESSKVNNTHWSAYFLNLQNIINVCWDAGTIVGPGRGSGVGFILLYLLDIIQINCCWETTATFSWRFLNPSRVSVLDIDTDIEGSKRAQVLKALREYYGEDRVANVVTFRTEKSKSAILTAARGLNIDVDISQYISSLIPSDRGTVRTLKQCYYGDEENGFAPVSLFVKAMKDYPQLWQVAQKVEGLICGVGEHAGGVIFVDEPFTESTALMRVPNGDIVTQFELHTAESASLIKIDLLSVECLDKIHTCIDLICDSGFAQREPTLRATYEKLIGIYNLERKNPKMWKMVWDHKIQSLFQMEQQSGIKGIALTHPQSVDDLSVLNSIIRLMAQSKDDEAPLEKYTRFKNDISEWYKEMDEYHLTKAEKDLLNSVVGISYGIAESQEKIMQLVQIPECGGFDLTFADSLRKAVAKFLACYKEIYSIIIGQNR